MLKEEVEASRPRNGDNSYTTTPDSGSNDVAKESHQKIAIKERLANKMFSYARKIIRFFLAIIFTTLAALHSSSPKVSKPPLAKPFFNQSSIVLDFYKGHLGAMIERVTEADFSFVMYYAPWDAESQAVRQEFETVAQYYHSQIFFAAINCWHPNSECRAQYNKIQSYPVLMLYPSRDSGIEYRGTRTWPYMIKFLNTVMNPIVRITHKEQLTDLRVNYDIVVVGYFNFTRLDKTPGYKEFYKAALRTLEEDPNRELAFAIVTSALSSEMDYNIYKLPSANLFMRSKFLRYPEDSEWTSENILNWISSFIHQPVLWLQPPGVKALTLAPYLREGPVLFLFTPRNPLHYKMDHLLFVRVDGDNNDLPWEYNMNRFPSILFFPAKRKEDSTVYPFSLSITIPNLVNFILANLDEDSHVEALVNICQSGAGIIPDACIARTRWLCLDIIQQLLRDYRKLIRHITIVGRISARNKRKVILLKLAHIKDIHLILSSTVDLREDQHKVKLIRKKYRKYYKNIRSHELDSKVNSNQVEDLYQEQNVLERKMIRSEL